MSGLWHHWLGGSWTHVVALTLAHFLWQGVLIGFVALGLERLLRQATASSRYVLLMLAMVSLPACFALTLVIVDVPETARAVSATSAGVANILESAPPPVDVASVEHSAEEHELAGNSTDHSLIASDLHESSETNLGLPTRTEAHSNSSGNFIVNRTEYPWLPSLAPLIVILYLLGVAVFILRLMLAVWGGHRLRAASRQIDDSTLLNIVADQARRLGLRVVPGVAFCERVAVPTVVGMVRPIVLLPASLITGLAPEQIAAIITHELVHIRRYDLLFNLLQRLIESLLFFHPVVWYLSRRISREREVCCDDMVVSSGFEPMDYAGALLRMAELCAATNPAGAFAASATGNHPSDFESRVRRLMMMTRQTQLRLTPAGAIQIVLLLLPLVIVPPAIVGVVKAQESQHVDAINDTLQFQMAVRTSAPQPDEDVNAGKWQVAVDWKVPIQTEGGSGRVISEVDGAILRIEWQAVRRHNGGLQFDGFNWSIDNPIDRRDGVSLGGIGGRQISPKSSWFGDEFESLASMQLDTAIEQKSDRTLVFRARHLSNRGLPKRLSILGLTTSGRQQSLSPNSEDEAEFQRQLNELQALRINRRPTVDEVEDIVERLLISFPHRAGEIHAQAAHVLGQSGIKMFAEDVGRFATKSLTSVSDPVGRARLFMYLSNAHEVQGRMDDANYWALRGLLELQPMQLREVAPELPGLGAYRELLVSDADAVDSQIKNELFQRLAAAELQARETAKQTQQLVQFRDIYIQILRRLNKTADQQKRLQEVLSRRIGPGLPLSQLLQATFEPEDAEVRSNELPSLTPERKSSSESGSRFQTAYDSDPSFGRASIKHTDQRGTIANWNRALQHDVLTREQQIFAWWRIGALAAYNFNASQGESAANDLAAKAFRKVLSIGEDLICRETINAATVYATLGGGTREDQASRMEFTRQWLETRTEAMIVQSAWLVNHNGYGIDGHLMPGGMNLQTEAEKAEYLAKELDNARVSVAARARMAVAEKDRQVWPVAILENLADRVVAATGSPTWKLHHLDKLPAMLIDDSLGYRITLRRTWKEYSNLPQQLEASTDQLGPFEVKHEDWQLVVLPCYACPIHTTPSLSPKEQCPVCDSELVPAALSPHASNELSLNQIQPFPNATSIPWQPVSSPYHTQAVCMGAGDGFVWYSNGTLFGQETIREKLKLTGGDDRIELLVTGMQIEDEGNITSNSCQQQMARFGDEAIGPIAAAIENSHDPSDLRRLIGALAFIRTDAATQLLMQLHQSNKENVSEAADYALVHRPLRRAAMPAYLNMLIKRRHVDVVCEGCIQFNWKEAWPILDHLIAHPESLRELSWTVPARRELQGKPIAPELFTARQTIISDHSDPVAMQKAWQTFIDSDDFEAVVLIGIELATYTTKGSQQRINEAGVRLLLTQPRDEVKEYLEDISQVMPPENAKQVTQLIERLQGQEQVRRLNSHGFLMTPDGVGGTPHRDVMSNDSKDKKPDIENIQALTGKWTATLASHHLLDPKLVEANQTGFVIAIDKQFGESYRRTSDAYENQYRAFVEQEGHAAVASGTIKFDYGGESELMVSRKDSALYLWYGIVTGGNPRIFLQPGTTETSIERLAIEWTSSCSDSPVDLSQGDAKVVYERPRHPTAPRTNFQRFSD